MKTFTTTKLAIATLAISFSFGANASNSNLNAAQLVEQEQATYMEKREGIQSVFKNFREKYPELVTELSAKERAKRDALHERREARINNIQHIKSNNWAVASNRNLDNMIAKKGNSQKAFTLSSLSN